MPEKLLQVHTTGGKDTDKRLNLHLPVSVKNLAGPGNHKVEFH
jgi:hypothetical protein